MCVGFEWAGMQRRGWQRADALLCVAGGWWLVWLSDCPVRLFVVSVGPGSVVSGFSVVMNAAFFCFRIRQELTSSHDGF